MVERRDAGFSLVEMLVSLALLSLISLLLLQAVGTAGLLSRLGGRMVDTVDLEVVRDHLRVSLSRLAGPGTDGRRPPFRGEPQRLAAMVVAERGTARGGVMRQSLWAAPRADGMLDLVEDRDLGITAAAVSPEVLVRGATGLQIRYFGGAKSEAQPHWAAFWTRRDRPPALVEITVAFAPGDPRRWPPLIVPLGIGR